MQEQSRSTARQRAQPQATLRAFPSVIRKSCLRKDIPERASPRHLNPQSPQHLVSSLSVLLQPSSPQGFHPLGSLSSCRAVPAEDRSRSQFPFHHSSHFTRPRRLHLPVPSLRPPLAGVPRCRACPSVCLAAWAPPFSQPVGAEETFRSCRAGGIFGPGRRSIPVHSFPATCRKGSPSEDVEKSL